MKNLSNKLVNKINRIFFLKEYDLRNFVENNLEVIFSLELIKSEFKIDDYRIDSLCYCKKTNSFVVIEYKTKTLKTPQGLAYMKKAKRRRIDLVSKYNKKNNSTYYEEDFNWDDFRLICVASEFDKYLKQMADKNCELWEYYLFTEDVIIFNPIINDDNETSLIKIFSTNSQYKTSNNSKKEVRKTIKNDNDETNELLKTHSKNKIFTSFVKFLKKNIPLLKLKGLNSYIKASIDGKKVFHINLFKDKNIIENVFEGGAQKNGKKSRGFFEFKDNKTSDRLRRPYTLKNGKVGTRYFDEISSTSYFIEALNHINEYINHKNIKLTVKVNLSKQIKEKETNVDNNLINKVKNAIINNVPHDEKNFDKEFKFIKINKSQICSFNIGKNDIIFDILYSIDKNSKIYFNIDVNQYSNFKKSTYTRKSTGKKGYRINAKINNEKQINQLIKVLQLKAQALINNSKNK